MVSIAAVDAVLKAWFWQVQISDIHSTKLLIFFVSLQKLLAKLCWLPPLHQGEGRGIRAVPVLPPRLQGHLPQGVVRQVGRPEGGRHLPRQNLNILQRKKSKNSFYIITDSKFIQGRKKQFQNFAAAGYTESNQQLLSVSDRSKTALIQQRKVNETAEERTMRAIYSVSSKIKHCRKQLIFQLICGVWKLK